MRLFDYERAARLMSSAGVDLLLLSSRPNVGYFADYWHVVSDEFYVLWDTSVVHYTLCGIPRDESRGAFLVPGSDERTAVEAADPWIEERHYWGPGYYMPRWEVLDPDPGHPMDVAAEVLRSKGLGAGTIAVEERYLGAGYLRRLQALLPDARFVDAEPIAWALRLIKGPEEQRRLSEACERTASVWRTVSATFREGDTELKIQRRFQHAFIDAGMTYERAYVIVGPAGKSLVNGTPLPGETEVRAGRFVRCDIQARYEGYVCNLSRVAPWRDMDADLLASGRRVADLVEELATMLRPGVPVRAVRERELTEYEAIGIRPLVPYAGHGVGRVVHEPPYLSLGDDTVLAPGMVVTLEPGIVVDRGGEINVCIEDQYLITEDGARCLTGSAPRQLFS